MRSERNTNGTGQMPGWTSQNVVLPLQSIGYGGIKSKSLQRLYNFLWPIVVCHVWMPLWNWKWNLDSWELWILRLTESVSVHELATLISLIELNTQRSLQTAAQRLFTSSPVWQKINWIYCLGLSFFASTRHTRSSADAARPRDASCHWIFREVTQGSQGHSKGHLC